MLGDRGQTPKPPQFGRRGWIEGRETKGALDRGSKTIPRRCHPTLFVYSLSEGVHRGKWKTSCVLNLAGMPRLTLYGTLDLFFFYTAKKVNENEEPKKEI